MPHNYGIVHERKKDGFTYLSIDTKKAKYFGRDWHSLSDYYKRKLETSLVISRPKERLKIIYGNQ